MSHRMPRKVGLILFGFKDSIFPDKMQKHLARFEAKAFLLFFHKACNFLALHARLHRHTPLISISL